MKAKEYLRQVSILQYRIEERAKQLKELREITGSAKAVAYDGVKVMGGPAASDKMADQVAQIVDLEREIKRVAGMYVTKKNLIIGQIDELPDPDLSMLLHLRYIDGLNLWGVAQEMHLSYDRVRHMHGSALRLFEKTYDLGKDSTK